MAVQKAFKRIGAVLLGVGFLLYIAFLTRDVLRRTPAHEITAEVPGTGMVTVQLTTDPYPALPTGKVRLYFEPRLAGNTQDLELESLTYSYGREGVDTPDGGGEASPIPDRRGTYQADITFGTAGRWWVRTILKRNGQQAEMEFTVVVEPAQ